jgi:hypothetical protein
MRVMRSVLTTEAGRSSILHLVEMPGTLVRQVGGVGPQIVRAHASHAHGGDRPLSVRAAVLTILLTIGPMQCSAQPIINPDQSWGPASNGLRMAISPVKSGAMPQLYPEFYVALQNVGHQDVILNLGIMLANGQVHLPTAFRLILTDARGRTKELQFSDKRFPGVGGRIDDFIVPLRTGAFYVLRLKLDQYYCPKSKEFDLKLEPGRYQIIARFEGARASFVNPDMRGIALMRFWTGTLESNSLEFDVLQDERIAR